ncbi:TIGR03089 family protein [Tessaracoccus caeni]|uniref:TIGR03089 family protein n=1 Tax=Tessaracoccus caeni TaxID=3031239 RepID=UPI0023DCCB1B|nr:TIGR03089 family protein [Tessaracoccus caeni]MDF1488916.1 TIGR03089 family protein [Tessaracoccus caeni]
MFTDALQARVRAQGAGPLITHYDVAAGSRIELSAITFANWVSKTANLIEDLGLEPGATIDLGLAETDPGHWVTLVWIAAAWQRGCGVTVGVTGDADLAVVGPADERRGPDTVACSLHPLGAGFSQPPAGCIDYAEVFSQPDLFDSAAADPASPAYDAVTHADVATTPGRDERLLFADPAPGWASVRELLVAPVSSLGSSVVVVGGDDAALARIAEQERARAATS